MTVGRFTRLILGDNLTGTDNMDGTLTIDASGGGGGLPADLAYVEGTNNVQVSATTEGGADTIVTAGAISFDGSTRIGIEFVCGRVGNSGATSAASWFVLYDGSSSIGLWGRGGLASLTYPVHLIRYLTPSNASHTYSVRGFAEQGDYIAYAGAGGSGNMMPLFMRIWEAPT